MHTRLRILALVVLLGGCAGAVRRDALLDEYLPYAGAPVDSFHFFRLDSWAVVGRYQLVIWVTPFEAYLVTVQSPCEQLAWTNRLAVTSTVNTISKFESIVLRDHERCPVTEIRPIDLKAQKAARAAARAAAQGATVVAPAPSVPPGPQP
jgi:hypothetical protein